MPVAPPSSIPPAGPPVAERLHAESIGNGPPVVLAHGFTQTGRIWGSLDVRLAVAHRIVRVDLPGHGRSSGVRATLAGGAGLLADAGGRAAYVGYSMGARFCLQLALARPGAVERLVLISGTAGIEDPEERRARRRTDAALADELDPSDGGSAAVPVDSFVRRWLQNPMFAGLDPTAAGLEERLTNTGPGLASSLRLAGTGAQRPRWGALHRLRMPVLIITGGRDGKFCALGQRMAGAIGPNARHRVVRGAGHAPHLERPVEVADLVRMHLDRREPD
jgi:2-succinyl-6-hydroxy-2,4-cyclohexadiene-1-carboxylate synthase